MATTRPRPYAGELPQFSKGIRRHGIRGTAVMEYLIGVSRQSALMLAARIALPHVSVSVVMSLPKSAGEPASAVPPKSANRAMILGSARPALISLLSFSTISAGVAFGAPMPYQELASKPGKN